MKDTNSVSNTKEVYNVCHGNTIAIRGLIFEIQHLLKLLGEHHYISRYKYARDIFGRIRNLSSF